MHKTKDQVVIRRRVLLNWFGWSAAPLFAITVFLFLTNPSTFLFRLISIVGIPTELGAMDEVGEGVKVHDDYYTVEYIDPQTIAIGEPRYYQKTVSYLILGNERAVLLDSGPGIKDIASVVSRLTSLPVMSMASHLHYDHVGNLSRFPDVAMIDLPNLRNQVDSSGFFQFENVQHLGAFENISPPRFKVTSWLSVGSIIDLGERSLQVISTPGHTPESLMLYDTTGQLLFTGDYLYPGELFAILPGAHMGDYLETSNDLLSRVGKDVVLLPGHNGGQEAAIWRIPRLGYQDLVDLNSTLKNMLGGAESKGIFPRRFEVNSRIKILAPFAWNMDWTSRKGIGP